MNISVIIPIYNAELYIDTCIQSVLHQKVKPTEIICVDDGSTDNTLKILEKYMCEGLISVKKKDHSNAGDARNFGLEHAKGDYILFLDADDYINENLIAKCIETINKDNCDVVVFDAFSFDCINEAEKIDAGIINRNYLPDKNPFYTLEYSEHLFEIFGGNIWNKVVKRDIYLGNNIVFSSFNTANDEYASAMVLACAEKISYVDEKLYYYRTNNKSSIQGKIARKYNDDFINALIQIHSIVNVRYPHLRRSLAEKATKESINSLWKLNNRKDFKNLFNTIRSNLIENNDVILEDYYPNEEFYRKHLNEIRDVEDSDYLYSYYRFYEKEDVTPYVSVVIPVYNGYPYIKTAIDSIYNQTFENWEIVVISEYGTNDGTDDYLKEIASKDERIKYNKNDRKLGLAESINEGIRLSKGKYIARLDADDYSHPERLSKQVHYLETHLDVGVLGTWQHHYGKRDWIHTPSPKYDKCRAVLLFDCNMCHSTIMFRKSVILENDCWYREDSYIEDFDLWSRLIRVTKIENIPEVEGEYLESDSNISISKMEAINNESAEIVANNLKYFFDIEVEKEDYCFLKMFEPAIKDIKGSLANELRKRLKDICKSIFYQNQRKPICNDAVMMHVLHYWWVRENTGRIEFNKKIETYSSIDDIFFIDSNNDGDKKTDYESRPMVGRFSYGPLINQGIEVKKIGSFCSFAPGTKALFNHKLGCVTTHEFLYASTSCKELSGIQKFSWESINTQVEIGNDVWLGENVLICNGAKIGNGVIAAAGSVITKDIPDYAIVAGNPARIIRYRYDKETIEKLNTIAWWNWPVKKIKEAYDDFLDINVFIEKYYKGTDNNA